jgi:two-component system sensor histidine kinase ChvG
LVFVPAVGFFYLGVYETQLLRSQERSMVQQGRILAAALSERGDLLEIEAQRAVRRLERRVTARLRVVDAQGRLLADSSRLGPLSGESSTETLERPGTRRTPLYRVGAVVFRAYHRLVGTAEFQEPEAYYDPSAPFGGEEVLAALAGRYGAITRITPGQRSVTLYSAIPVRDGDEVVGAVLVSQSTFRILQDLYELRLAGAQVFLASLVAAAILSLLMATTIVRPLRRLRREANQLVDHQGRLRGSFGGSGRRDEIGDLARSLEDLSARLHQHVHFFQTFAADVSHEFKNPLASIRTATEMAAEVEDPADIQRLSTIVLEQVARLERLLSEVREITVIDARLESELRQRVDLSSLLESVVEGMQRRFPRLRFEVEVEPHLEVDGIPERLAQVFENLLDNAVSYSPEEGTVAVRARGDDIGVAILVDDSGPGVPVDHRARVFDRFFSHRPGTGESARHEHSGLGLAIVRAIVEGYGGSVGVQASPAGGARFSVVLPLAK